MSRRDQIRMSDEEALAFLEQERTVICATNGRRGWPHLMPLWYVLRPTGDGGAPQLWAWTFAKSQKARNLERDPRATLLVEDGVQYNELRGVMLECDVDVERDPERVADYGLRLFRRYGGGELEPGVREAVEKQAPKRVGLLFRPTRVVSWDHSKLGGTY
jgi:PPOX class probable F420-dependent enzyme